MAGRANTLAASDILDNTDVRNLCGGITRKTLIEWRHKGFPAPFKTTGSGVELWARQDVMPWLRARSLYKQRTARGT